MCINSLFFLLEQIVEDFLKYLMTKIKAHYLNVLLKRFSYLMELKLKDK